MPRTCTVCTHPKRLQIERAMVAGTSLRNIAGRFGPSKTAITRHRTHVASTIARHTEALDVARTDTILGDVRTARDRAERLYSAAESILDSALEDSDGRTALYAIKSAVDVMREARGYLELRGQLTGELAAAATQGPMVCIVIPQGGSVPPDGPPRFEGEVIDTGRQR
jgi:hypothetical protein